VQVLHELCQVPANQSSMLRTLSASPLLLLLLPLLLLQE
jgi:hypothetical protein